VGASPFRTPVQSALFSLKNVTLSQQSAAFCQNKAESPKKAAIATVFGLPPEAGKDVDMHAMHVDLHTGMGSGAGLMGELFRLKVDRTEKGQGL
jgi:hypothetical protein